MPLFDYRCRACGAAFELLLRGDAVPACPHCGDAAVDRCVSRIAPAGRIEASRMAHRRAAAAAGHLSHYGAAEQARLLKRRS